MEVSSNATSDRTRIERWVREGEFDGQHFEAKSALDVGTRKLNAGVLRDLTAMGNGGGGAVVFGLSKRNEAERSRVAGLSPLTDRQLVSRVLDLVRGSVRPNLVWRAATVDLDDGYVMILDIEPSPLGPYMVENLGEFRYWVRLGHRTVQMSERLVSDAYSSAVRRQALRQELAVNTVVPPIKDGQVLVDGTGGVQVQNLRSTNRMQHRMYPDSPIVHQDIFEAQTSGAITKLGTPSYDDTTYTSANPWNSRPIIKFGSNNELDGNGAEVTIPQGYDTVWLRVLGDRWNVIKAYFIDDPQTDLGLWTGGQRSANCFSPDGSTSDGTLGNHQWVSIPTGRAGHLALISKPNTNADFWLSGVAFSMNPWAHAAQSAVAYHWASNGGDAISWDSVNWNSDVLARIDAGTSKTMRVPVVPSGRDKLLYVITHNPNDNDMTHTGITVNRTAIERLITTYDNPFGRHWNSKLYERYAAARIPASLVPQGARFLDVAINRTHQQEPMYIREVGTHDLEVPGSG